MNLWLRTLLLDWRNKMFGTEVLDVRRRVLMTQEEVLQETYYMKLMERGWHPEDAAPISRALSRQVMDGIVIFGGEVRALRFVLYLYRRATGGLDEAFYAIKALEEAGLRNPDFFVQSELVRGVLEAKTRLPETIDMSDVPAFKLCCLPGHLSALGNMLPNLASEVRKFYEEDPRRLVDVLEAQAKLLLPKPDGCGPLVYYCTVHRVSLDSMIEFIRATCPGNLDAMLTLFQRGVLDARALDDLNYVSEQVDVGPEQLEAGLCAWSNLEDSPPLAEFLIREWKPLEASP